MTTWLVPSPRQDCSQAPKHKTRPSHYRPSFLTHQNWRDFRCQRSDTTFSLKGENAEPDEALTTPTAQELGHVHTCPPPESTGCVLLGKAQRVRGTESLPQACSGKPQNEGKNYEQPLSGEPHWLMLIYSLRESENETKKPLCLLDSISLYRNRIINIS
jgi:hypothetical protein